MIRNKIMLIVCILLISSVLYPIGHSQNKQETVTTPTTTLPTYIPGTYLVHTQWGQHGSYKRLCPNYYDFTDENPQVRLSRLGCWSVAIGQILHYYEMQSEGIVNYWLSHTLLTFPLLVWPFHIINNLFIHMYNWSRMPYNLTSSSSDDEITMTSQFCYDVSCVIQKDFGNGRYQTLGDTFDIPALQSELYEHFEDIDLLFWIDELDTLWITAEIDNYRPIMLYIRSVEETRGTKEYHAVVLDGYMWDEGTFKVHLNYGWDAGNPHKLNESWYEYDSAFPLYNDTTFRQALLIIADPPPQLFGPKTGPPDVTHTFQTKTINRNVSTMYYKWDWGDGTFSDWMGRYASGELCSANHSWKEHGIYPIRVQASDLDQWESKWSSPHTFYIPKYQAVLPLIQILINLIQRFPRSEPLILPLIQRFCT